MTKTEPEAPESTRVFDELLAEVTTSAGTFGHREHVHLTWLAVHRVGMPAAIALISDGIQRTARYAGAPQKYHVTVSRAWVELIAHHTTAHGQPDFAAFTERHPALLDKRLLTRFYRSATLAGTQARTSWVEPDLAPFPWTAPNQQRPQERKTTRFTSGPRQEPNARGEL
ncbi:hypothetical protein ACQEV2_41480 [Streptomyces sp. CA-251387]|uniref:hypothetical protein n=1 Tax=Streptomyces sp. CA-251387 TaxID=3240064 RepID=UPI003D8F43D0